MTSSAVLAGQLQDTGNHLLSMGSSWGDQALKVSLVVVVVVTIIRKFSLKAGIGSLLCLVLCLGIYNGRTQLADAVKSEFTSTSQGAGFVGGRHPAGIALRPDAAHDAPRAGQA
ncbi:hypothetical protein [Streptomyces sp. WM6378]|uniref:hypothetical protein n=1 Tax=Streptomyces sp. WM6378 TaxID=1415557 RepID=UPI0006B01490|nr:hypothetical protein [Streptomyces sp. WM6378]KOU37626.1 hypothetical protein ADK54_31430 [Streptomyces sp. WM6378]